MVHYKASVRFSDFTGPAVPVTAKVIANDAPADTVVVGAAYDRERDVFMVRIASASFDQVEPGDRIPLHLGPMIERVEEPKVKFREFF